MLTNKQLLKIWTARKDRRLKTLKKLKALGSPKVAKAEYQYLVARNQYRRYKKLVAGKKLAVEAPPIAVDRAEQGNVHGSIIPRVVVLHSTESHDHPGTADVKGILEFLERTEESLGIHYVVDKDGNVGRGARTNQLVYHARGANSFSIGIEQIGFAHSTQWKREDRLEQLERVAKILAYLHRVHGIPLKRSTTHGIALHRDFPSGGHTDPGVADGPVAQREYPAAYVIRLAQRFAKTGW